MENTIPALQIKDGLFEAGKIDTSFAINLQTLCFYIQSPEIWQAYCEQEPESAQILKETLAILVLDWQTKLKEQKLADTTELKLPEN